MIKPKDVDISLSDNDCIAILDSLKERGKHYDEFYKYFGEEYCEILAGIEKVAIDRAIEALRNRA